jgi:hypothetical protein
MYGYGYRYTSGLVLGAGGGAPFVNTNSLLFDGVDDYLSMGNVWASLLGSYTWAPFSMSFWYKGSNPIVGAVHTKGLFQFRNSQGMGFYDGYTGAANVRLYANFGGSYTNRWVVGSNGVDIFDNQWHNLLIVLPSGVTDGVNPAGISLYIDGSIVTKQTTGTFSAPSLANTWHEFIFMKSNWANLAGTVDEIAFWSDNQSANATAIYNSGVPNDLTSLNPLGYWRNGDNGSYKSPQWLMPSNENKDKVSNYSMEFDGVDDYVSMGINTGTNDVSISYWIKTTDTFAYTSSRVAFGGSDTTFGGNYALGRLGSAFSLPNDMVVRIFNTLGVTKINDGIWHHIAYTYDYTTKEVKAYVDGALDVTATVSLFRSKGIVIGGIPGAYFNGKIDECGLWYNVLTASEITGLYNGGIPNDLTSLSPIGWWKTGEDATFSGGVWTVPDAVGSNNGTSNAMTIEDRVGNAPNSESNALSFNMDEVDRVTDTP